MRNLRLATLTLACALLAVGGCTSGDKKKDRAESESWACAKLMGKEGMAWLKNPTPPSEPDPDDPGTVAYARSEFRKQVPTWKPKEFDFPHTARSEMCDIGNPKRDPGDDFVLTYGAAAYPFDKHPGPNSEEISVRVGPDAKLVYGKDHQRDEWMYYVYVKCGAPGAPASQLNDVTLEGWMSDRLTGDPSHRTHLRYLLHSAKVMADAFDCTNNPQIPTTVPSSVKD
ncbi:hypothetical protein ACQB60_33805 [Actinomycetota bacterium Odt1-20B]